MSGNLNNETHFDEKKKDSTLKKKHCKNNGCNLTPLTAEQDLSYEEILVSPYSIPDSIKEQTKTHKILFFHFFLVEKQKIQLQKG